MFTANLLETFGRTSDERVENAIAELKAISSTQPKR